MKNPFRGFGSWFNKKKPTIRSFFKSSGSWLLRYSNHLEKAFKSISQKTGGKIGFWWFAFEYWRITKIENWKNSQPQKSAVKKETNWTLIWQSILALALFGAMAWKINSTNPATWFQNFNYVYGAKVIGGIFLILVCLVSAFRPITSKKKSDVPINEITGKPTSGQSSESSISWMRILKNVGIAAAIAVVLWFGYHEWERRTALEEQKMAAARQEARDHPALYRDSLTLTREWSEWIKPDSLFRPNNTHAGWMFPGDVTLEIQDARGRIFKEGPRSHKRVDYAINQDSLRFRTPKRDSTWFILTLTPIQ